MHVHGPSKSGDAALCWLVHGSNAPMTEPSKAARLLSAGSLARESALAGDSAQALHWVQQLLQHRPDHPPPQVTPLAALAGATIVRKCLGLPPCPSAASPDSISRAASVVESLPECVEDLVLAPLSAALVASLPPVAAARPDGLEQRRYEDCAPPRGTKRRRGDSQNASCAGTPSAAAIRRAQLAAQALRPAPKNRERFYSSTKMQPRLDFLSVVGEPLPEGWCCVPSRSRPKEYSYLNVHTLERQVTKPLTQARRLPEGWSWRSSQNRPGKFVFVNKKLALKQATPPI